MTRPAARRCPLAALVIVLLNALSPAAVALALWLMGGVSWARQ